MTRRARRTDGLSRVFLAVACALVVLCAPALGAARHSDASARLKALRERLEHARGALSASKSSRAKARERLRASERAISAANRTLHDLAAHRRRATSELKRLTDQEGALQSAISAREQALGRLLAAIYMSGHPGTLRLLLSGRNPGQIARNLRYLSYVSRAQADFANSLRAQLKRLDAVKAQAREKAGRIDAIAKQQQTARKALLAQRAARKKALARVSDRIRAQSRKVKTLERDQARLARLVREIARRLSSRGLRNEVTPRSGAGDFSSLKGRLRLPVRGLVTHRFGSARAGGGPRWKGLFIRARSGEKVLAVARGRVVFADWMRGYGNLLILDHGGGYLTIYGNNESLLKGVGDRVAAGEPIALVGASGGSKESGLYFEIRYDGKAFDPLTWARLR